MRPRLVILAALVLSGCHSAPEIDDPHELLPKCKDLVLQDLYAPSTAQFFPDTFEVKGPIDTDPDDPFIGSVATVWFITGEVDAQSVFGATARYAFSCIYGLDAQGSIVNQRPTITPRNQLPQ